MRLGLIATLVVLAGCGGPLESDVGTEVKGTQGTEELPGGSEQELSMEASSQARAETRLVLQSHGFDDERAVAVAIDGDRNIIVLASFRHVGDFGTGLLPAPSPEAFNLAIVKYRWDGQALWVRTFGTAPGFTGDTYAHSLAVDRNGDIVFAGRNLGPIDFGQGLVPPGGFLVKLDARGQLVWSRSLSAEPNLFDSELVIDRSGNIALAGSFDGVLDFGTGPISAAMRPNGSASSAFLAKFDSRGRALWVYGDPSVSEGLGLAVEDDGDLILCGEEAVGQQQLVTPMVIKFNPPGRQMWSRRLTGAQGFLRKVAVQGGTVVGMGHFSASFRFAGHTLKPRGAGMLLVAFQNTDGRELWGRSFDADGQGLSMDDNGVFVTGAYRNGADLGLGPLVGSPGSQYNVFVARYHRLTGSAQWTKGFIATGIAEVADMATTRSGESVIGGSFRDGTVDFGTGPLVPESRDMFLFSLTR